MVEVKIWINFLICKQSHVELMVYKIWEFGYFRPMECWYINSQVAFIDGASEFLNSWLSLQSSDFKARSPICLTIVPSVIRKLIRSRTIFLLNSGCP